jgi:hypothetical protein
MSRIKLCCNIKSDNTKLEAFDRTHNWSFMLIIITVTLFIIINAVTYPFITFNWSLINEVFQHTLSLHAKFYIWTELFYLILCSKCVIIFKTATISHWKFNRLFASRYKKNLTEWYIWPLNCWDCKLKSQQGDGCLLLVSVVDCCQRPLQWADPSSRGVQPSDNVWLCVIQKPHKSGSPGSCWAAVPEEWYNALFNLTQSCTLN